MKHNNRKQSEIFSVPCFSAYATLPQNNPLQIFRCCGRYGKFMNRKLFLLLSLVADSVSSGSLYSFEKNIVLINALNHIQARYSDLAKSELKPRPLQASIDKSGRLVVSAIFSYEAKNEFGLLFVCAKVDENGNLLNIKRDINARKGIAAYPIPESPGCWGEP